MSIRSTRSPWIAAVLAGAIALPNGALLRAQTPTPTPKPAATTQKTAAPPSVPPQVAAAAGQPPAGTNADTGWPRTIALNSGNVEWYQPQVESWENQKNIVAWSAVSYTPSGGKPALGTIKIEGPTKVSVDERVVSMDLKITQFSFPSLSPDQVKTLVADVQKLPERQRVIDLDRLLAYVADSPLQVKNVEGIKADPPKIFANMGPAILIGMDGEPIWSPIKDVDLKYAVNTNWDLFQQTQTNTYYVRDEKSWMQATALAGPWTPVDKLPDSFKKLPADDNWKEVKEAVPGKKFNDKTKPKVFYSEDPAELIQIDGAPLLKPVVGAGDLQWVSNTEADLFRMGVKGDFYFLVAGRWFKSASLDGPWTFATPNLPEEFKKIPVEHERSRVLASIPGTSQATEAILLASIPRTARVNKKDIKAPTVDYAGGKAEFQPIEGAQGNLQRAVNTDKDIIKFGDLYYMCFQAVWFMAKSPDGPWEVASSVPKEIYTIPASSPANHVTYVTVEDNDDEWVTFAYAAAYTGMMIGWGCVVWGSGWYYPPYRWYGGYYPGYYPYARTYGMGAWYNPYTGGYGRGYAAYGPYGGVGVGSAYNPRTGTYARGAAAYGPGGSRSYGQAYNPRTGTYAQTRQGSNVYGNWGSSSVQRGDNWAQTAHADNYRRGTETNAARTSSGAAAIGRENNRTGSNSGAIRTSGGDIYAGRDGNVYRNTGGGWESSNGSGGWNPVDSVNPQGGNRTGTAGSGTTRPTTGAGSGTAGSGTATRPTTGSTSTSRPTTGSTATSRPTSSSTSQLDRDKAARSAGQTATTNRSTLQSGGMSRSGASSMGRSMGGGGRRGR
jgi:hypothetical protein